MNDLARLDLAIAAASTRLTMLLEQRAALTAGKTVTVAAAPDADPLDAKARELRDACRMRGLPVTGDDHVDEGAAASLLAKSAKTLRNWRAEHRPIPFRKRAGRIEYALMELARHLVEPGDEENS